MITIAEVSRESPGLAGLKCHKFSEFRDGETLVPIAGDSSAYAQASGPLYHASVAAGNAAGDSVRVETDTVGPHASRWKSKRATSPTVIPG